MTGMSSVQGCCTSVKRLRSVAGRSRLPASVAGFMAAIPPLSQHNAAGAALQQACNALQGLQPGEVLVVRIRNSIRAEWTSHRPAQHLCRQVHLEDLQLAGP